MVAYLCTLTYTQRAIEADRRHDRGERQVYCLACELWRWPGECDHTERLTIRQFSARAARIRREVERQYPSQETRYRRMSEVKNNTRSTPMTSDPESPLVTYARRELTRAGMFDADADYGGGAIAGHVLELITVLASAGHSGGSHALTMALFDKLARFEPLTDSDHSEYKDVSAMCDKPPGAVFQDTRDSRWLSWDGGKTWQNVDALPSASPQ